MRRRVDTKTSSSVPARLIPTKGSSRRRRVVVVAGEPKDNGFVLMETAFNRNLNTLIAENTFTTTRNICTYLNDMKDNITIQLTLKQRETSAIKFNVWLDCIRGKPEPHCNQNHRCTKQ
ncbi:hypothetical protein PR048_016161, partial [Dryococelus australis]